MHQKYPRTFHFKFSPGTTSDDRIGQDVQAFLNREIVITEKLDGENNSSVTAGLYARSHATFTTSAWSLQVRNLHAQFGRYIPENLEIFGEGMAALHAIEYTELASWYYVFGAREDGTKWYSWSEVEETAFLLDLPTVPVLFKGIVSSEEELKSKVLEMVNGKSALGGRIPGTEIHAIEGCVVRVADSFDDADFSTHVMKWVRKNHVDSSKSLEHWTKNWKKAKLNQDFLNLHFSK